MTRKKSIVDRLKDRLQPWADNLPRFMVFGSAYTQTLRLQKGYEKGHIDVVAFQRDRLAALIRHTLSTVPFYRRNYNIRPQAVTPDSALETLRRFEPLDKATITAAPQAFLSDSFRRGTLFYKTSGGSTGRGVMMYQSMKEAAVEQAFVDYPILRLGFGPRSMTVRATSGTRKPQDQSPFTHRLWRVGLSVDHCSDRWMPEILRHLGELQPQFLLGYPSIWEVVAQALKGEGRRVPVRAILLESEQVFPYQLELFKEVFGQPIWYYGLSEKAALAYGELKDGNIRYRLVPIYSYVENLPTAHGKPEIVGTSLSVYSMPFLRYRTEDIGQIDDQGYITSLDGRSQEMLVGRDGTIVPGTSVHIDPFVWEYVESYQFVQRQAGALELHLVRRPTYTQEVEKLILAKQSQRMGGLFSVRVVYVNKVERTAAGKRRLIVSHLSLR